MFNVAKHLIKIEQNLLINIKDEYEDGMKTLPYNQLDIIDSLVDQIEIDTSQ